MDIGTGAYTEYETNKDLMVYMMKKGYDLGVDTYMGHIHSHNSMAVYFSGTDEDELCENVPHHNAYLSLIVNNRSETVAKVAHEVTRVTDFKGSTSYSDFSGEKLNLEDDGKQQQTQIVSYDATIEKEDSPEIDYSLTILGSNQDGTEDTHVEKVDAALSDLIQAFLKENFQNPESTSEWDIRISECRQNNVYQAAKTRVYSPGIGYTTPAAKSTTPASAKIIPGGNNSIVGKQRNFQGFDNTSEDFSDDTSSQKTPSFLEDDDVASFTRTEVEDFLKICFNVTSKSRNVTIHEFFKEIENSADDHTLAHLLGISLKNNYLQAYIMLHQEDIALDHIDEMLDECVSIVDSYYATDFPRCFGHVDEALAEVIVSITELMDQDPIVAQNLINKKINEAYA